MTCSLIQPRTINQNTKVKKLTKYVFLKHLKGVFNFFLKHFKQVFNFTKEWSEISLSWSENLILTVTNRNLKEGHNQCHDNILVCSILDVAFRKSSEKIPARSITYIVLQKEFFIKARKNV